MVYFKLHGGYFQLNSRVAFFMVNGLLDFIFRNITVEELDRKDTLQYLVYLNEIITSEMSPENQIKYLAVKVRLNNRLVQLDKVLAS